jgi:hypothetical protein
MPLSNAPRILRGAFIEYGLSVPPLIVVFQFNPVELTRNRSLAFAGPNETILCPPCEGTDRVRPRVIEREESLLTFHRRQPDLSEIQKGQQVTVQEETISFEIRLDATDKLEQGDSVAAGFGVLPQLATLERMVQPKKAGVFGAALNELTGIDEKGFSFSRSSNPPMILFIWGNKRVLPVNINSLNITETEFSTMLDPIRATVAVNLTVIEGQNPPFTYTKLSSEVSSLLNLGSIESISNVVIPG